MAKREKLLEEYEKHRPTFDRLNERLVNSITAILDDANISYLTVYGRVKGFPSLFEKVQEKEYETPFEQNEDFVGIRVISYFLDDIDQIGNIIDKNFAVISTEDKSEQYNDNEFGYRSVHKIMCIPDEWAVTPDYKNLNGIKCELQIRTVLMHAWAEVEHKLKYKNKASVPAVISRKFSTISGMFENIDIQFQEMRKQVSEYVTESAEKVKDVTKDDKLEINHETLKLYLRENHSKLVGVPTKPPKYEGQYSVVAGELKQAGYRYISELDRDLRKDLPRFKKSSYAKLSSEVGWVRYSIGSVNPEYSQLRKTNSNKFAKR